MNTVERIVAAVRREYPHAVNTGTFRALFQRHDEPTDILPSPNGPPVFVEGGVAVDDYTYRPTGEILSLAEFETVCLALDAMRGGQRNPTPAEILRNKARAKADAADEGGRRYGR